MHELAIAQSIVDAVEAKAIECNAARVKGVRLKVGEASGIAGDSLAFGFEMLTSMVPILKGAHLLIDSVPHRARCHRCETEFAVANFVVRCPTCQEWSADIVCGTELQIVEMEIEKADEEGAEPGLIARRGDDNHA
jgi:hydrogenase nickel incorporation protein HypA/HybF